MSERKTAQQVYEAMRDSVQDDLARAREVGAYIPPVTWEEVDEHAKAVFAVMAFKMNCIAGEFSVEA